MSAWHGAASTFSELAVQRTAMMQQQGVSQTAGGASLLASCSSVSARSMTCQRLP